MTNSQSLERVPPEQLPLPPAAPRIPTAADLDIDSMRRWNEAVVEGEGDVVDAAVTALAGAGADMSQGHIARSTFRGGSLADARFDECSLHDVHFTGVDLAGANFRRASLQRVRFDNCRLVGAKLMEAKLRDVAFVDCIFDLANLRMAQLERVSFAMCQLHQTDCQGLHGASVRMTSCDFAGATLHRAEFQRSRVVDCDLEELAGVDGLKGCTIDLIDAIELAPKLASALGIRVWSGAPDGAT